MTSFDKKIFSKSNIYSRLMTFGKALIQAPSCCFHQLMLLLLFITVITFYSHSATYFQSLVEYFKLIVFTNILFKLFAFYNFFYIQLISIFKNVNNFFNNLRGILVFNVLRLGALFYPGKCINLEAFNQQGPQ